MVEIEGLEPSLTEPESVVLPLHHISILFFRGLWGLFDSVFHKSRPRHGIVPESGRQMYEVFLNLQRNLKKLFVIYNSSNWIVRHEPVPFPKVHVLGTVVLKCRASFMKSTDWGAVWRKCRGRWRLTCCEIMICFVTGAEISAPVEA